LKVQAYRSALPLELSGELDGSGAAKTLTIDDEGGTVRFLEGLFDESLGYVTPLVLESLGIETSRWIAKPECHLSNALLAVIPCVATTQESHDHARTFGDGTRRFDVG
jgi:hypothetical protein